MRVRLVALAAGTFAVGIGTFVTAGLVEPIARDLKVSQAAAGQLVTVFAISYAVLAPLLATATARLSRKHVMLAALVLFLIGNVATALAPSYPLVLAARAVAAAGAAMYAPNAYAVAAAIASPERRGRAMAAVLGGLTAANVLGVPLGAWLGGTASWRATIWLVAVLGTVALAGVAVLVPDVRLPVAARLRDRLSPLRDRRVAASLALVMVQIAGFFVVYTYLGPLLAPATGGDTGRLALLLWVFGLLTVVGNVAGGRLADALDPHRVRVAALTAFVAVLAAAPLARQSFGGALVWVALLALPGWLQVASHLRLLIELAPKSAPLLLGLNSSAQFLGMGASAAIGGAALNAWGPASLAWIAAGLTAVAAVMAASVRSGGR